MFINIFHILILILISSNAVNPELALLPLPFTSFILSSPLFSIGLITGQPVTIQIPSTEVCPASLLDNSPSTCPSPKSGSCPAPEYVFTSPTVNGITSRIKPTIWVKRSPRFEGASSPSKLATLLTLLGFMVFIFTFAFFDVIPRQTRRRRSRRCRKSPMIVECLEDVESPEDFKYPEDVKSPEHFASSEDVESEYEEYIDCLEDFEPPEDVASTRKLRWAKETISLIFDKDDTIGISAPRPEIKTLRSALAPKQSPLEEFWCGLLEDSWTSDEVSLNCIAAAASLEAVTTAIESFEQADSSFEDLDLEPSESTLLPQSDSSINHLAPLVQELSSLREERITLQTENENLQASNQARQHETVRLEYMLDNSDKKIRELKSDAVEYECEVTALTTDLAMIRVEKNALEGKLRLSTAEKDALQRKLRDQADGMDVLEKALREQVDEKDTLENNLREQAAEKTVLKRKLRDQADEKNILEKKLHEQADNATLDKALREHTDVKHALEMKLREQMDEKNLLERKLDGQVEEQDVLGTMLHGQSDELKTLEKQLAQQNDEKRIRDAKLNEQADLILELQAARDDLTRHLTVDQEKLANVQAALAARERESQSLFEKFFESESDRNALQMALDDQDQYVYELETRLQANGVEIGLDKVIIAELEPELGLEPLQTNFKKDDDSDDSENRVFHLLLPPKKDYSSESSINTGWAGKAERIEGDLTIEDFTWSRAEQAAMRASGHVFPLDSCAGDSLGVKAILEQTDPFMDLPHSSGVCKKDSTTDVKKESQVEDTQAPLVWVDDIELPPSIVPLERSNDGVVDGDKDKQVNESTSTFPRASSFSKIPIPLKTSTPIILQTRLKKRIPLPDGKTSFHEIRSIEYKPKPAVNLTPDLKINGVQVKQNQSPTKRKYCYDLPSPSQSTPGPRNLSDPLPRNRLPDSPNNPFLSASPNNSNGSNGRDALSQSRIPTRGMLDDSLGFARSPPPLPIDFVLKTQNNNLSQGKFGSSLVLPPLPSLLFGGSQLKFEILDGSLEGTESSELEEGELREGVQEMRIASGDGISGLNLILNPHPRRGPTTKKAWASVSEWLL